MALSSSVRYPLRTMEPISAFTAMSRSTSFKSISSRMISASLFNGSAFNTFSFRLTESSMLGFTSIPITDSTRLLKYPVTPLPRTTAHRQAAAAIPTERIRRYSFAALDGPVYIFCGVFRSILLNTSGVRVFTADARCSSISS